MFSVAIICVMLILGIVIHQKISDSVINKNREYETAIHVETQDVFEYGMRTNVGNAFVYGEYVAVDPVTNPDIEGEWSYLERITKKHTMHTRTVTTTDGKGHAHTRIETYYTWDTIDRQSWKAELCTFLGHEFDAKLIDLPEVCHIKTIRNGNIKYEWYGKNSKYTGTIYAKLENNTISNTTLYEKSTIETMEAMKSNGTLMTVGFWVLWVILIAAAIFGFYYLENNWLE